MTKYNRRGVIVPEDSITSILLQNALRAVDSMYFDYLNKDCCKTEADAAYLLATWLFDQGFMDSEDNEMLRQRLKKYCSPSLYLLALEYFIDGFPPQISHVTVGFQPKASRRMEIPK